MSEDDDIRALFFNSVGGPDEHSSTWADAVMSLTRRLKEQAEGTVTSNRSLSPSPSTHRVGSINRTGPESGWDVCRSATAP